MRALGYKVIVLNPTTVTGIEQDIMLVGRATGAQTEATAVVANISNTISNIQAKIAAANITTTPTVYYEIWNNPFMSVGAGSWISDAIAKAGGVNIFENVTQAYPTISSETIVQLDPSVILLPSGSSGMAFYGSIDQVKARPGWNTISAVQNNRIYIINQDLFSEPAPRVGQLVQDIADCLYPQLFNSTS
jgi:iron complex transport system substrate-binding protein